VPLLGVVGAVVDAVADPADGELGARAVDADDLALAEQDILAVAGAVDSEHQLILPVRDRLARRAMRRTVVVGWAARWRAAVWTSSSRLMVASWMVVSKLCIALVLVGLCVVSSSWSEITVRREWSGDKVQLLIDYGYHFT
jgi:hypothetical protein